MSQKLFESKLEEYRSQKRKENRLKKIRDTFHRFWFYGSGIADETMEVTDDVTATEKHRIVKDVVPAPGSSHCVQGSAVVTIGKAKSATAEEHSLDASDSISENTKSREDDQWLRYTTWLIGFVFWCTLYAIAIELKFGLVFLMFSALFGIYFNTRTGPKTKDEISAYSVFNENCESIDGTLKAEQFEREIRFGPGSVR